MRDSMSQSITKAKAEHIEFLLDLEIEHHEMLISKGRRTTTIKQHLTMIKVLKEMILEVLDAEEERLTELKIAHLKRYGDVGRKSGTKLSTRKKESLESFKGVTYDEYVEHCEENGYSDSMYTPNSFKKMIRNKRRK